MNQHASKNSVPPTAGVDVGGTERCSTAIFQKYSVKVIRLAEGAQELDTEDCVLYVPPGTFVGRDVATNTRESRFRKIAQRTS
jgi:hypothetical protein